MLNKNKYNFINKNVKIKYFIRNLVRVYCRLFSQGHLNSSDIVYINMCITQ